MDTLEELRLVESNLMGIVTNGNPILDELRSFLLSSSKMIRSKLALLYLKSNNAEINEDVIKLLTAGELIHNASLLHDDIIDSCDKRRGKDTIGKIFSPKVSILCGDLLVSKGVSILQYINNHEISETFIDCINEMCNAEIKQYLLRNLLPSENEYIDICKGKTAELFKSILKSVSILTKLDINDAINLGLNFGMLFQLNNDINPISADNDAKNGIKTMVDICGIEKTMYLIDNYRKKIEKLANVYPNKVYSIKILDLLKGIC